MSNQTYARPALLVAHTRSGGTMLNYALSTHRRIFWTRGEPLLRQMEWGKAFPGVTNTQILDCITRASFYTVAGCKVTYEQMTPGIWKWIKEKQPRLLHLVRENWIRVALSQMITGMVVTQRLKHRAHSFKKLKTPKVYINPQSLLARANRQQVDRARMVKLLARTGAPILNLTYKQITGGKVEVDQIPRGVAEKICDFLGVRYEHLTCDLRRVNRAPLSEIIENWEDVRLAVGSSSYRKLIEGKDNAG